MLTVFQVDGTGVLCEKIIRSHITVDRCAVKTCSTRQRGSRLRTDHVTGLQTPTGRMVRGLGELIRFLDEKLVVIFRTGTSSLAENPRIHPSQRHRHKNTPLNQHPEKITGPKRHPLVARVGELGSMNVLLLVSWLLCIAVNGLLTHFPPKIALRIDSPVFLIPNCWRSCHGADLLV